MDIAASSMTFVYLFCLWVAVAGIANGQALMAGSIFWRPGHSKNEMVFTYRLAWQQNVGTCDVSNNTCLDAIINHNVSDVTPRRLSGRKWVCKEGCTTNTVLSDLSELTITTVDEFKEDKWEMGEGEFTYTFNTSGPTMVKIWLTFGNGSGGELESVVDLTKRPDTNKTNTSPLVAVLPIYRMSKTCKGFINLYVFDGDGDDVQCNWSPEQQDTTPTLDQVECQMSFGPVVMNRYKGGEFHQFRLTVQDYNHCDQAVSNFSLVSVLIAVRISSYPGTCAPGPTLNGRTPNNGFVKSYDKTSDLQGYKAIDFESKNVTDTPKMFASVAREMLQSTWLSNNTIGTTLSLKRLSDLSEGIHVFCSNIYSEKGIWGDGSCTVFMIGDVNDCRGFHPPLKCPSLAKCYNAWNGDRCIAKSCFTSSAATRAFSTTQLPGTTTRVESTTISSSQPLVTTVSSSQVTTPSALQTRRQGKSSTSTTDQRGTSRLNRRTAGKKKGSSGASDNTGMIAGIAVGALVLVGTLAAIAIVLIRKNMAQKVSDVDTEKVEKVDEHSNTDEMKLNAENKNGSTLTAD